MNAPQSVAIGLLNGTLPVSSPMADRDVRSAAIAYHRAGFNVGVQTRQSKGKKGLPWKLLQYNRLIEPHLLYLIEQLDGVCNLFVMTGRTSLNLCVIDCETSAELEYQCRQFRRRCISLWVSQSNSPKNGGHIWFFCREGEIANIETGKLKDMEVRGNRCYILVPPSVHPSGSFYAWQYMEGDRPPTVSITELDWLPLRLKSQRKSKTDKSPLSPETLELLAHGAEEGTRHAKYLPALCNAIAVGIDTHELETQARADGLSNGEIRDMVQWATEHTEAPAEKRTAPFWQRAAAFGQSYAWKGRTAATDRAVWSALCRRARDDERKGIFRASEREIAELAHYERRTVKRALLRFMRDGLLIHAGYNKRTGARLVFFASHVLQHPTTELVGAKSMNELAQDRALSHTAMSVWHHLLAHGDQTERQLRDECGLSRDQVVRAVRRLSKIGAVFNVCGYGTTTSQVCKVNGTTAAHIPPRRRCNVWRAVSTAETELDHIANGVIAKTAARHIKHSAERSARACKRIDKAIKKARV